MTSRKLFGKLLRGILALLELSGEARYAKFTAKNNTKNIL
jgi:hypothetical protein